MSKEQDVSDRCGKPGGPGCAGDVRAVSVKGPDGQIFGAEFLAASRQGTELELLRSVAARLGVQWGEDDSGWWAVMRPCESPSWAVWRQNDSGNRFVIERGMTESDARAMVSEFDRRGHKQTYWCKDEGKS